MVKTFKAHPLMIFNFVKPFLFVLLIPIVDGILQYVKYREVDGVLAYELFLFAIIMAVATLRWRSFSLICDTEKNTVTVKRGLVFKRIATVSVSKLSSVQTEQNPIDFIFRAVTFRINTEAGLSSRADFEFKLGVKKSAEVSKLLYKEGEPKAVKFSAVKVAVLAATTSSAFTGIVVGVPVLNQAGRLLGVAISDMLLNEINNISSKIETHFPPIVNTISLIILLFYFISFVYSFLKYVNFKLFLEDDKMEVRSGFFTRTRTSFRKSAINDVRIEQSIFMILLRRFAMKVSVGGYGDGKGESEVIIPLEDNQQMKKKFAEYFSFFMTDKKGITPRRDNLTKSRFLFFPSIYFLLTIVTAIILSLRFQDFTRFILFLTCVASGLIFCHAWLCLFEYNHGIVGLGENIYLKSNKGLRTCEMYCPKENVGEVRLVRFPPDFIYKTCRIRVAIRSERADSVKVRHLDYQTVKNEVFKCFNIE